MKRYELKYVIAPQDFYKLESILLAHPAGFSKAYPNRIVNNIYFDSVGFKAGYSNLGGVSDRTKVRYRWYGSEADNITGNIELKIKNNTLGYKKYIKDISYDTMDGLTQKVNKNYNTSLMYPSLVNRYTRQYYVDTTERYRLTIDHNIAYQYPQDVLSTDQDYPFKDYRCIVEIKFDSADYRTIENVSQYFPFRLSKHSKYVTGLFSLYG